KPGCSDRAFGDLDPAHKFRGLRPDEIDRQKAVIEPRAHDIHAVGKHEGALELPGRDAAMEIGAPFLLALTATNDQLILLKRDRQLITGEARNRERDAQHAPSRIALTRRHVL